MTKKRILFDDIGQYRQETVIYGSEHVRGRLVKDAVPYSKCGLTTIDSAVADAVVWRVSLRHWIDGVRVIQVS